MHYRNKIHVTMSKLRIRMIVVQDMLKFIYFCTLNIFHGVIYFLKYCYTITETFNKLLALIK